MTVRKIQQYSPNLHWITGDKYRVSLLGSEIGNVCRVEDHEEIVSDMQAEVNTLHEECSRLTAMVGSGTHYDRVRDFMKGVGQPTPDRYTEPTEAQRILRARLVLEEVAEFITKGLGVSVGSPLLYLTPASVKNAVYSINLSEPYNPVEMIDGVCDIHVTATGALIDAGLPHEIFQKTVDENNLDKIRNGHRNPETGKWEKHPDHQPPDIEGLLNSLGGV